MADLPENYIAHLQQLAVIHLSGEESRQYLQGQVTCDVKPLRSNKAQLGCHCDFKGKCWNVFYTLADAQNLWLLGHKEGTQASLTELKKYAVFAKTEIRDATADCIILGAWGEAFERIAQELFGTLPTEHLGVTWQQNNALVYLAEPQPRYLLIAEPPVAQKLQEQITLADEQWWEWLDIQAGLANIQQPTCNQFVPQMLNLQALDAINFKKGCYMGQEVVARTKYLGKNKRAAFILGSNQPSNLQPGDTLEMQAGEHWRRSGSVLRVANTEQGSRVLAVLPNDSQVGDILRSKNHPEYTMSIQPLPYSPEN